MVRRVRTVSSQGSSFRDFSSQQERERVWREASRQVRLESRTISRRADSK